MKNNYRQFLVYDLEVAARKRGASIPQLTDLIPVWQRMQSTGELHRIRADSASLLIGDISVDHQNNALVLLVRISDRLTSNSVYSDPSSDHFQEHTKSGREGSDFGVHVLISTAPERNLPNVYTCIIERVPGLAADLVRRLLTRMLLVEYQRNQAFFQYRSPGGGNHRDGTPRMERCRPHLELRGRPSQDFIADINQGRMTGLTLIKSEPHVAIAGASFLRKERSELRLSIDHNSLPLNVWSSVQTAMQRSAATYSEANLSFRLGGTNRNVSVKVDTATGSPLSELYITAVDINNVTPLLAQSSKRIVGHVVRRVVPHLLSNRHV